MKRLLAAGYPDIFQICRVFRDGEAGRRHLPEFTLIEWYRIGASLAQIIDESAGLVAQLLAGTDLATARHLDYRQAFQETTGLDPLEADPAQLAGVLDADASLRAALGDDRDAWLDLAIAEKIAPSFAADRLTALHHYPASQASLARLSPADERLAERFELYLGPLELANGFVELTDAAEQAARFDRDRQKRASSGRPDVAVDGALIAALEAGLPACAGVALGLDRLLMIDQGLDDIAGAVTFLPGAPDDD
jgi:lysyl-tRNA synthetase class 2